MFCVPNKRTTNSAVLYPIHNQFQTSKQSYTRARSRSFTSRSMAFLSSTLKSLPAIGTPRVLRLALRATAFRVVSCETAFDACPSAVPWDGYSSCLESRIPWTALWVEGSSCLESLSLGVAVWASSGCPESCFDGWVDDGSPSVLELCIPGLRRG
jgi:hypothetical protein